MAVFNIITSEINNSYASGAFLLGRIATHFTSAFTSNDKADVCHVYISTSHSHHHITLFNDRSFTSFLMIFIVCRRLRPSSTRRTWPPSPERPSRCTFLLWHVLLRNNLASSSHKHHIISYDHTFDIRSLLRAYAHVHAGSTPTAPPCINGWHTTDNKSSHLISGIHHETQLTTVDLEE